MRMDVRSVPIPTAGSNSALPEHSNGGRAEPDSRWRTDTRVRLLINQMAWPQGQTHGRRADVPARPLLSRP